MSDACGQFTKTCHFFGLDELSLCDLEIPVRLFDFFLCFLFMSIISP